MPKLLFFPINDMMTEYSLFYWTTVTGLISALATGLGAIPVHFVQGNSKSVRGFASGIAAGMMTSASVFSLAQEGIALKNTNPHAPYVVILGLLLGAAFFWLTEKTMEDNHIHESVLLRGFSKKGFLIFIAMFIHSIPEGIAIGVGFATGNLQFGLIMAMAIAVHNIPEGMAVSLPLKAEGVSTRKCAWISILTSAPQPLLAFPAAYFTWLFQPLLPIGLGFAGGAMIYIVVAELIPDALEDCGKTRTAWGFMLGLAGMLLITNMLELLPL